MTFTEDFSQMQVGFGDVEEMIKEYRTELEKMEKQWKEKVKEKDRKIEGLEDKL